MEEFDCKKCLHEKVCSQWASRESQNASCICTDGCHYFTPTLTLVQLRERDGEPVWFDTIKRWGIVRVCGYGISVLTKSGEYDVTRMKFYRRPPEGEANA